MSVPARLAKPVKDQDDGFVIIDQGGVYICGLRENLHQSGSILAGKHLSKEQARHPAEAISAIE